MSKAQLIGILLLLHFLPGRSQYASIALNEKSLKEFGSSVSGTTLAVVINNEKDPFDAALVNAVKTYWKQSPYKFMSRAEFVDKRMNNTLPTNQYYLYQWFSGFSIVGQNALQITEFLNNTPTGLFFLSYISPKEPELSKKEKALLGTTKFQNYINLDFDLSSTFSNSKDKVLDGYFDLMVKYFNHEVDFCKNFKDLKSVAKEDKNGYSYFNEGLTNLPSKDILLVKEQIVRAQKLKEEKSKRPRAADAVAQFEAGDKSVFTVFPEDVKMAVQKSDKKVVLYTNDMLISAENGAVIAAPGKYSDTNSKPDLGFWFSAFGIMVSALAIAFTMQ